MSEICSSNKWSRQYNKKTEWAILVVINEKRSSFRPALVRGYEAEKLGQSGKEVGKTCSGKARRGKAVVDISVEIVCSTPAGKSLINSGLVCYLTDLKDERKERKRGWMTEKRKGWLVQQENRACCISGETRREAVGSFYGPRLPVTIIPLRFQSLPHPFEKSSCTWNAFVSLKPGKNSIVIC